MPSFLGFWGLGASAPHSDESHTDESFSGPRLTRILVHIKRDVSAREKSYILQEMDDHNTQYETQQHGDYLRYDIANFEFILVKDRDGNIMAFTTSVDIEHSQL